MKSSGCWAGQAGASQDLNLQESRGKQGLQLNGALDQSTEQSHLWESKDRDYLHFKLDNGIFSETQSWQVKWSPSP